ncbi:LytR C-terminal domain-containing protein [Leucobacter massiliensis]|uniref:LytR C-terminal domain-containing protein n=1 Tax=Leucobacter massiliensis TaxID=1686285 RepID=UPI001FEA3652|nr:LytR C-terminal domain-containing protein [Leucobacter massiliensis]
MTQTSEQAAERRGSRGDFPEDRFDRVEPSGRVGAHRITARPRYVWQYLVAGLLGFALLTTLGIVVVQGMGGADALPLGRGDGESAAPARVQAELNPDATVAVLNGTETPDLAATVDGIITSEQWGQIRFSGAAASSDVSISAVFYADPADEAAAEGLAAKLGGLSTYVTEDYADYGVQLVVLLGADYAGPGLEEAQQGGDGSPEGSDAPESDEAPAGGEADGEAAQTDPATGWPIDPATGWPVDPATGQPTDPATIPAG